MGWLSRLTERFAAPAPASDEQILARLMPMWQSARPLPQPHDYRAFAQDGFRRNAVIFACITEISTSAAEPPLDALRMRGEDAVPLPATDPLSLLLARPNPEQSRYELLSTLTTHLHVAGNGYLHKVRARNGKPVQLWPLRPDRVEIKPGRNGLVESYAYSVGGQATLIPAEDVVHFTMHPDPLDDYYGLSPIAVLARFGDLDNSATDFLRAFFLNAGVPGGLLTFKSGRVLKDERERIRQSWRDQFSTAKGWHDVGVMDADVSYQELGSVPKKLDLSTIWGVTESRICMVFGVPAVLVGAWIGLQNSTFANYETAQKSLWQETLSPFYVRLADKLTMGVASEFGPDRLARFDLSKVQALQEARAVREARAQKNWENGLLTMNEARVEQGYPEVPDGNMRKTPAFSPFPAPVQQRRIFPVVERHALPKFVDNAPDDPFYLAVHKIADRLTPELRDAFLRGVLAMDGGIDQQTLIAAVESGDMERAFAAIPFEAFADSLKTGGGDVLLQAIAEAGASAALTLQDTHGLTITFDLTNPRAQQFAATQTATMVTEVTEGTKDAIRAIIERGFSEGLTPQQMAMEIRQVVGLTSRQAAAVTNFRASLMADGIEGDVLTNRVEKYAAAQLRYRGTMIARTECLSGETVVDGAVILAAYRRWYDGEITEIITSSGRKFTTTPNHPMLTNRGWMAASEVHEGDNLVCNIRDQNAGTTRDPDVTRPPATIAEIFDAVAAIGITERRVCTQPDFHGDGQEGQVEIARPFGPLSIGEFAPLYEPAIKHFLSPSDPSRATTCNSCRRLLSIDQQPCFCASTSPDGLLAETSLNQACRDIESTRDTKNRFSGEVTIRYPNGRNIRPVVTRSAPAPVEHFAGGREGSDRQSDALDSFQHSPSINLHGCSDRPSAQAGEIHIDNPLVVDSVSSHGGIRSRAEGHVGCTKPVSNAGAVSADGVSDLSAGEPGQIELDRVLSVVLRKWSGHVFNLSTPFGYFTVDGVYTGNTLSASNAGQRELWMQASEKGLLPSDQKRVWILTPDGRLCTTICEPMDGVEVGLNEPWKTSAGPVMIPQQAHVQCLPGNTQVTPGGRIAAVSRRWYNGDLISIRTASGKQLSCTTNHPILTDGGWRSAHDLGIGGYVISSGSREGMLAGGVNDQHMPASIEQIAEAFRQLPHVFSAPMPLAAEDFHGDGKGSDVAIVWTNSLLRDEMNRSFDSLGDHIEEQSFSGIDMETEPLIEKSTTALSVKTVRCSFDSPVSGSDLAASFERGHLRPLERFGRTLPSLDDAIISQPFRDDIPTDVISLSQGVAGHTLSVQAKDISDRDDGAVLFPRGLRTSDSDIARSQPISDCSTVNVEFSPEIGGGAPGEIFLDEIIKIDRVPFSGHVYNLHTEFEFYVANGIITHNCRCAQGLVIPK